MTLHLAARALFVSAILATLMLARPAAAQSTLASDTTSVPPAPSRTVEAADATQAPPTNDITVEQQLAVIETTAPSSSASPSPPPVPRPDFPRLEFGAAWEASIVGSGSQLAGGLFGIRLHLAAQFNRWFAIGGRLSATTLFVAHVAHAAAFAEFRVHPMFTVSAGVGAVAFAFTMCVVRCDVWSNYGVTAPIRVAYSTSRRSGEHGRTGYTIGAEFFPGIAFVGSIAPLFGGGVSAGYEWM